MRGNKKVKQPSLLHKFIEIHHEQALRRKALRILSKQDWSVEFLTALIAKAARNFDKNIIFTIENKNGIKLTISSVKALKEDKLNDSDNIFDKLDDDAAIDSFISLNSVR